MAKTSGPTGKSAVFFLISVFLLVSADALGGQQKLQEKAVVTAVEVPVRVLFQGKPLKGLKAEDFEIYHNGVKQQITHFEANTRKISSSREIPEEELIIKPGRRLFVLIFNVFDYNDSVGEAIDYFFANLFQQGDEVMVIIENKALNIETGTNLAGFVESLKDTLKKYKALSTKYTYAAYRELDNLGDELLVKLRTGSWDWQQAISKFYDHYKQVWLEYSRQFLVPNVGFYRSLMKRLKQREGEKWAVYFHQRFIFPRLKQEGTIEREIRYKLESAVDPRDQVLARLVQDKQMELLRLMDVSGTFPTETMNDLFMEGNVTFHLVLMKSSQDLMSLDFELKEVAQDYEDCFRQISRSTGGYTTLSNKVVEALKEAADAEDHYYLLVYSPQEEKSASESEIEVKVKKEGVRVLNLKHLAFGEAPPITIKNFETGRRTIKLSLVNYQRVRTKGVLAGYGSVKITLFDEASNKVFDEEKSLTMTEAELHISLDFEFLERGRYFIIIQAVDLIANEVDVFTKQIEF